MSRQLVDIILRLTKQGTGAKDVKKALDDVTDSTKKQKGAFDSLKGTYTEFNSKLQTLQNGLAQLKKVYDFGKEGANILQMRESFDRLMDSMGVAPGILGRLRDASLGTVDDMSLMSSTMTMLAGTSEALGQRMAESSPQLLKIAKAAQALNPAAGDVEYFYSSITAGIKRSSPLILDNLGLVIKIGQASEDYARALGKTADELTAEERQLALLEAALESGDRMIQQVGGDVSSMGDSFAQAETQMKNAGDEIKIAMMPVVRDLTVAFANLVTVISGGMSDKLVDMAAGGIAAQKSLRQLATEANKAKVAMRVGENMKLFWIDQSDAIDLVGEDLVKLGIAAGSTWGEIEKVAAAMDVQLEVEDKLLWTSEQYKEIYSYYPQMYQDAADTGGKLVAVHDELGTATFRMADAAEDAALQIREQEQAELAAKAAADEFKGSMDLLEFAIRGEVGQAFEEYKADIEELDQALAGGEIDQREYASSVAEVTAAYKENSRELAFNIAEKQILDALEKGLIEDVNKSGTAYDEANAILWTTAERLGLVDQATKEFMEGIQEATTAVIEGKINVETYGNTMDIMAGQAGTARDTIFEVGDRIRNLPQFTKSVIEFQTVFSQTGVPPIVPGTEGAPGFAFQHGGQFVVRGPSGVDRVPVMFRATAGEVVTVTPLGGAAPPNPVTNNYNLNVTSTQPSAGIVQDFNIMQALVG